MEKKYIKLLKKIISLLLSIGFVCLTELFLPFQSEWIGRIIAIVIVGIAINSLLENLTFIYKYVKKDFSIHIFLLLFFESIFAIFLIITSLNYRQRIYFITYLPLFWFSSGISRVIMDATRFQFLEKIDVSMKFIKNFAILRITFFFIIIYLSLVTYPEQFVPLIIAPLPFYIIFLLWYTHPVFSYLIDDERLELEIKIKKILYKEKITEKNLLEKLKLKDDTRLSIILNSLQRRGFIVKEHRRWRLKMPYIKTRYD